MRLRVGELVAGIGGLALLASLWLDWYAVALPGLPPSPTGGLPEETAWQAFEVTDVLLAAFALLSLALPVIAATAKGPAKPIGSQVIASALGGFFVLLVAYRLLNQPGPNDVVEVRTGAWIGLAATLAAWVGAWLAMRDESAPGVAPPDVPVRPAPPA